LNKYFNGNNVKVSDGIALIKMENAQMEFNAWRIWKFGTE
jgi:hypothetical protein